MSYNKCWGGLVSGALAMASFLTANSLSATVIPAPTVYAGSTPFNGSFPLANATNGTSADYASQGQGTSTYLEMNFGSSVTFDRVIAVNRNSTAPGDRFSQVTYTFSSDNVFTGDPTETINTNSSQGQSGIYTLSTPRTAQFVRWDVDTLAPGTPGAFNTGTMELLFLNTPANTQIITGVTAYNASTPFSGYSTATASDGLVGFGPAVEYASSGQGANTFVDFDLGAVKSIAAFDFIDRLSEHNTAFNLIFSNNSNFSSVITTKSYNKGISALTQSDTFAPVNARYVRYDVTAGTGNLGVSEMIFYSVVPEPGSFAMLLLGGVMLGVMRRKRV